jgi:SH3-like domain-containing protein
MFRRVVLAASLFAAAPALAQERQPPYWASIASGQAMMRTGRAAITRDLALPAPRPADPGAQDLSQWRLIEDPDGTRGWMLVTC